VRQLENVLARGWALAISEGARVIEPRHLFPDKARASGPISPGEADPLTYQDATRRFQAKLVEETLTACGWNVSEASRRLDVSRSHLNELIRSHGLSRRTLKG
jgi:Nif-specific regulatory protein